MGHERDIDGTPTDTQWDTGDTPLGVPVPCPTPRTDSKKNISEAISKLDQVAFAMEKLWGVNVLPLLVDDELRAKFEKMKKRLNKSIEGGLDVNIEKRCAAMARGWKALDTSARLRGNKPTGNVWVGWHPSGAAVCVTAHGAKIVDLPDGVLSFSVDELVAMIPPQIVQIKKSWKDSTVKRLGDSEPPKKGEVPFDDALPF